MHLNQPSSSSSSSSSKKTYSDQNTGTDFWTAFPQQLLVLVSQAITLQSFAPHKSWSRFCVRCAPPFCRHAQVIESPQTNACNTNGTLRSSQSVQRGAYPLHLTHAVAPDTLARLQGVAEATCSPTPPYNQSLEPWRAPKG